MVNKTNVKKYEKEIHSITHVLEGRFRKFLIRQLNQLVRPIVI